jgi:hypothetical protein
VARADPRALFSLSRKFEAVGGRLDPAGAARTVERLAAHLRQTTDPAVLAALARFLAVVTARLGAAQPVPDAARVAGDLLAALGKTADPVVQAQLALALASVCGRLDPAQAAAHAVRGCEALVAALPRSRYTSFGPRHPGHYALEEGLRALGTRLDPAGARKVAAFLVPLAAREANEFVVMGLVRGLEGVSERLDAAGAEATAGLLRAALLENDSRHQHYLGVALKAVAARLDGGRGRQSRRGTRSGDSRDE